MSQAKTRQAGKKRDSLVESQFPTDEDIASMSINEIMSAVLARNKDPVIAKLLDGLVSKLPQEFAAAVESDKRSRSLVISGLPEPAADLLPSAKQRDVEDKVGKIMDVLSLECRPLEVYRMGRPNNTRPRLVKLVLPSRTHWITALSNSHRLRSTEFSNVFIRKSLSTEERKREYALRQECRERNKQLNARAWVVYRGELARVEDLPKTGGPGNTRLATAPPGV